MRKGLQEKLRYAILKCRQKALDVISWMLMHALNGFSVTSRLTCAAIGALVVYVESAIVLHFDRRNRARFHAIPDLLALFLIDLVHGPLPFADLCQS